jgi:hypothetical protein
VTVATAERTCDFCGVSIEGLRDKARFCSASCRGKAARGEPYFPPALCEQCGEELPAGSRGDRRFCGERCRTRAHRARIAQIPPVTTVRVCGRENGTGSTACSCGGTFYDYDEDGERRCLSCSRPVAV